MTTRSPSFSLRSSSLSLLTALLLACGGSVSDPRAAAGQGGTGGSSGQAGAAGTGVSGQAGAAGSGVSGQAGAAGAVAGASGQAGAPPASTLEQACRAFFARHRRLLGRCGPGAAPASPEPASVEPAYVASCVALASLPGSTLTPGAIGACAAAIPEPGCEMPACAGQVGPLVMPGADHPGTRAAGAPCESFTQCASGMCTTSWSGSASPGDCGVCQELRDEGQACGEPWQMCAGAMACLEGVCGWPGDGPGASCTVFGDSCRRGFHCDASPDSATGTCQPRADQGQACDPFEGPKCGEDLVCVQGVCTAYLPEGASCNETTPCRHACRDGVCRLPRRDAQVGEACTFDMCALGLDCSPAGVCQAPALSGEGQECSYHHPCGPGLLCSLGYQPGTVAERCVKEPGPGEPCADVRCDPRSVCVGAVPGTGETGQCQARGAIGQACPCLDQLLCIDGTCQPFGAVGCE